MLRRALSNQEFSVDNLGCGRHEKARRGAGLARGMGGFARFYFGSARAFQVLSTLSGLSEMETMPCSISQRAKSG